MVPCQKTKVQNYIETSTRERGTRNTLTTDDKQTRHALYYYTVVACCQGHPAIDSSQQRADTEHNAELSRGAFGYDDG